MPSKYSELSVEDKAKIKARQRTWQIANPDKVREYQEKTRNKLRAQRIGNEEYLAKVRERWANRSEEQKARKNAQRRAWRKANPDKALAFRRAYLAKYPHKRIVINLRKRLRQAANRMLKQKRSRTTSLEMLGCDNEFLRSHIESQFKEGMSWENYGEWHVDHIIPLCKFDLTDEDDVKRASHWSNLQPLWAHDNLSKGGRSGSFSGAAPSEGA